MIDTKQRHGADVDKVQPKEVERWPQPVENDRIDPYVQRKDFDFLFISPVEASTDQPTRLSKARGLPMVTHLNRGLCDACQVEVPLFRLFADGRGSFPSVDSTL